MGQAFKHLAVRMWTSLLIGALASLVVLPPLAGALGPGLMIVPAIILIGMAFWMVGIAFAALGRRRLNRLIGEATVWERAGMTREARQALSRAEATVDSYYFSPFSRKPFAGRLLAQLARFQLAQSLPESSSDNVVGVYLRYFPDDREAAIKWLEGLLAGRPVTQQSHDIAAKIGEAHADDMVVQRMLAQFYLAEGCCDFAAFNTYRLLVESREPLAGRLLNDITDLFLSQQRADRLALKAYIESHHRGMTAPLLVEGIAACCQRVHPTPLTQPLLEKAEAVLDGIGPSGRRKMALTFLPEVAASDRSPSAFRQRSKRSAIGPALQKAWAGATAGTVRSLAAAASILRRTRDVLSSRQTKTTVKWAALGVFGVAVGWLLVSTSLHLANDFKPVETVPEPQVVPVSDPFTLQVAAYLREEDARQYVTQLKEQSLDAYWTRASGNNKVWYQVRIAHFKTKAEARSMGEDLKNRHLIGDYYVANYKRPDAP